jgi:hypothetical protein
LRAVDAHKRGLESQNEALETVVDQCSQILIIHHFDEEQDPNPH